MTARADHEIYSSHLLTKKRGYPLWVPGPGMQLPIEYRRQGISIGDVGIISSTGSFDFFFNISLPADHPINNGRVPQGFLPLPRQGLEIERTIVYGPNTHLASASVRKISGHSISGKSESRFESTSEENAILVLPNGATTQNLRNTRGLHAYITSMAMDCYTYASDALGRDVRNGDILVVVGSDKVSSWGIATSSCNLGETTSYVFKHDPTYAYRWECTGGSGRVGPTEAETHDLVEENTVLENQCVFVRTMSFTLTGQIWNDFPSDPIQRPVQGSDKFSRLGSPLGNRGFDITSDNRVIAKNYTVNAEKGYLLVPGPGMQLPIEYRPGKSFLDRFQCLGDVSDMNKSLSVEEEAVRLTPDDHPDKPSLLNNLGISFLHRSQRRGDLSDMDHAISLFEKAVQLTPDDHPLQPSWLNNLGRSLLDRFQRLGDLNDMNKSVSLFEEAVRLTSDDHPDKPSRLINLGNALSHRVERLGDLSDMNKSVSVFEEAVRLTADDHPDKPSMLNSLGNLLSHRVEHLGDPNDMNKSVSVFEEAVRLTSDDHPDKALRLINLGDALSRRDTFSSASVYLGAPIDLMGLLVERKAHIEALFGNTGIDHRDLCFSAGFDEEVFANGGMFIQQAYLLSRADFVADEAHVVAVLNELGKTLSPYSGVVSTPSRQYYSPTYLPSSAKCTYNEYISFHAKQTTPGVHRRLVATLSPMMTGTGREGRRGRNGGDKKDEESSGPGNEAKKEGTPNQDSKREGAPNQDSPGGHSDDGEENHGLQQVETNNSESSTLTSSLRVASGAPDDSDPVDKSDAKKVIHFQVTFNVRHIDLGDQEIFNQSIRVEGTLQSEVTLFFDLSPLYDYYPLQEITEALVADVISSSHIRFFELAFYGNADDTRVDERYRQSDTEVKIDLGKGQPFHLFDVNPRSTPKLGTERKESETEERTRQLLTGISANLSFPWKPNLGGMCNSTIGQKGARTTESSVKVNRIKHSKTDQDTTWRYFIGDEWTQEDGLCLPPNFDPPSAKFSFLGKANACRRPEKLKVGIKSSWVMPDSGVRDAYMRFGRNIPVLRGLATQITFDIPPHMDAGRTVVHGLDATIISRENGGYGIKSEMEMENLPRDIYASLKFSKEAPV